MTKVIDLTEPQEPKKELKEIEFMKHINNNGLDEVGRSPSDFDFVERLSRPDEYNKYDLFQAWDSHSYGKSRYLGHFNDGIVK